jgi:hypothetical protein
MASLKTLTMAAVLIAGATSLAIAQGPPTGGYPPVGGGAAASPIPSTGGAGAGKATAHKKMSKHHKKSQAKSM